MKSRAEYKNAATYRSVAWAEKNRDKVREYKRRYKKRHLEKVKQSEWEREDRNIVRRLLISARDRAKQKGIEFSITEEDVPLPKTCPILGTPLHRERGAWRESSPSIDKIDPGKGYVPGNVWIISMMANGMKSNATPEQMLAFARWAIAKYGD